MKTSAKLADARHLAQRFCDSIADVCDRVEIAGSIRRKCPRVGDIEIVAIPKYTSDLLGSRNASRLDLRLESFLEDGRLTSRTKNGPKYKQVFVRGCRTQVDLFITNPECWPVIFAIRTGPADFSKAIVTPRASAGLLQNGYRVKEGRLLDDGGNAVELRTERDFFQYVQGGWVPPEVRK